MPSPVFNVAIKAVIKKSLTIDYFPQSGKILKKSKP